MSRNVPPTTSDSHTVAIRKRLREAMVTGIALTIPLFVTLLVIAVVANFVANVLQPVVDLSRTTFGIGANTPDLIVQGVAVVSILSGILLVGFVAEFRSGNSIDRFIDNTMGRIPGVGSVYTSFNEMSEMLLSNDSHSFREVYLVEYPTEGSYTVAFVTAETPEFITESAGHDEMVTLFMPMAPNPVMGGFVIHVAADRVYDVDMTVEEGLQSIVTSGVAVGNPSERSLSPDELAAIGSSRPAEKWVTESSLNRDEGDSAGGTDRRDP